MAASVDDLPRPGWTDQSVPLDGIEQTWGEQWARSVDLDPEAPAATRTLTSNLLVVGQRPQRMLEALEQVTERHACRSFLVVWDHDALGIEAHVLSRVADATDEPPDEVVMLRCGDGEFPRLVGLLRPLLVADIPVHLHWGLRLHGHLPQVRLLAELSEQISVDSGAFPDPLIEFGLLESLVSGIDHTLTREPVDLSHYRLGPWRQALAQAFELIPFAASEDTEVELRYCSQGDPSGGSFTLARWLRRRLGASVSLERCTEGLAPENVRPGDPVELRLHHGANAVQLLHREDVLLTQVTTSDRCMLPFAVSMPMRPIGALMGDAVAGEL